MLHVALGANMHKKTAQEITKKSLQNK